MQKHAIAAIERQLDRERSLVQKHMKDGNVVPKKKLNPAPPTLCSVQGGLVGDDLQT